MRRLGVDLDGLQAGEIHHHQHHHHRLRLMLDRFLTTFATDGSRVDLCTFSVDRSSDSS